MGGEGHPLALHDLLTAPVLLANCDDEQLDLWLPKALNYELNATYAQTELGHGNLRDKNDVYLKILIIQEPI